MPMAKRAPGRILLIVLTLWALAMVVPDLYRLVHPLASFGFSADGDGLVTDALGPFSQEADLPAWQAGLRVGDRLDLKAMRCIPVQTLRCATAQAVLGGVQLVEQGRHADLAIAAGPDKPARQISIVAKERPFTWWVAAVLPFDQIAAIFVVLAAAWLVWTRPGRMTWGFFLYVIWFNPGQSYQYYAWLQDWPLALLAQNILGDAAEGIGFAGFLLFALRVPLDRCEERWRPVEKALPAVALALAILLALGNVSAFGYPAEMLTRAGILSGFLVAAAAFAILLARRGELPPSDYQRLRWVIWGCLIGLPTLILADIAQETSLLADLFGAAAPPEEVWDLVRLINGVLCLFVFEAVRRPLVVSVAIPLRRVTILGLLLSAPTLLLHRQFEHFVEAFQEDFTLPSWAWLAIATFALFVISRLHELAVHHADHFFNRSIAAAGREIDAAILRAQDFAAIEEQLVGEVCRRLQLASASIFRKEGAAFRRSAFAGGWRDRDAQLLQPEERMARPAQAPTPFPVRTDFAERNGLPAGLARPVLAVPVADRFNCYAIALYGAHASGNDFNDDERAILGQAGRSGGRRLDRARSRGAAPARRGAAMRTRRGPRPAGGGVQGIGPKDRMRTLALVGLLASACLAGPSPAQERHKTIGDFQVEIDKDPLTLDSNVTATARAGERMFGVRCLEGKISIGAGSQSPRELIAAGETARIELTFDGSARLALAGAALNEQEIEAGRAEGLLPELARAHRVEISIATPSRNYAYAMPVRGADRVVEMVALACGQR